MRLIIFAQLCLRQSADVYKHFQKHVPPGWRSCMAVSVTHHFPEMWRAWRRRAA